MPLSCLIIDDEPLAINILESYIAKTSFLELKGSFCNAIDAMEILCHGNISLVFLDIQMPDVNGFEFSKLIPSSTKIVFTTAFEQYAIDSYRVNAIDYLLKPFSYSDFLNAANKVLYIKELEQNSKNVYFQENTIFIKTAHKIMRVELNHILYIEGLKDYLKIQTEDQENPIITLMTIKAIQELLPVSLFMRVHRSFIVNKSKIKVIERNRIVFGHTFIPISDSYKNDFYSFLEQNNIGFKIKK